jgi:hypothetical protein
MSEFPRVDCPLLAPLYLCKLIDSRPLESA